MGNLWSLRHWKEKMDIPVRHIIEILEANTADAWTLCCDICGPNHGFSQNHVLGPKHCQHMQARIQGVAQIDDFWQQWCFPNGAVAYNHLDGSIQMVRRPRPGESHP